jgi:glycosyltransferase involved in cell wall biosynthesis
MPEERNVILEVRFVMVKPRFTFCIPNLNKIDYLSACIDSMLAQDCDDWQCVFVDGYSTDGCWEYMQQFARDSRFRLFRGLKQGMYADWNECLRYVDTEYFYILTSDDTCCPELVSQTMRVLDQYLDVDVCHFQYALTDKVGAILHSPADYVKSQFPIYAEVNQYAHRRSGICDSIMHLVYGTIYMSITSLVFRKRILKNMLGFSSDYGPVGDYDWSMRLGFYSDIIYIPQLLATWRTYPEQATAQSDGFQAAVDYVKIATKNVGLLQEIVGNQISWQNIDQNQLVSRIKDIYIHACLELAFSKLNIGHCFYHLCNVIYADPLYPARKIKRRLSRVSFKQDLTSFAQSIVKKHDLDWPPVPLDLSSHQEECNNSKLLVN